MAVTGPSRVGTDAELGHILNPVYIDAAVAYAVNTPFTYDLLARDGGDLTGRQSLTWRIVEFSAHTIAASEAEGAEGNAVALANTDAEIAIATYAQRIYIGDGSRGVTVANEVGIALDRLIDAVRRKIDTDLLALAASISSTSGNASQVNDLDNLATQFSAFRALAKNPSGQVVAALHADAMRDLLTDIAGSGAAILGSGIGEQIMGGLGSVRQGPRMYQMWGVSMVESDRLPVGDTTGWTNMIVETGQVGALALAYRANAAVEGAASLGDRKVPVAVEAVRSSTAIGTQFRAWSHHGVGIAHQSRAHKFITRT